MKYLIITLILSGCLLLTHAQSTSVPILEREITIKATNASIEEIFNDISNQGGFIFSYSPAVIKNKKGIDLKVENKSVRFVLNQLFTGEITYKEKGKYLILRGSKKKDNENRKVEGYIYDSNTGEKLVGASVYDKQLLASAITDKYGYFSMTLPANKPINAIYVSKLGYQDTAVLSQVEEKHLKTIEVALNSQDPNQKKVRQLWNKIQLNVPKWLVPKKIELHSINLSDSFFRKVQFSVLPFVSTNRFLGGNVVNDISVNLTIGYNKGVKKMEFGGVLNIDRYDVRVAQFGGVGNIVGGKLTGFQSAGVFNVARNVDGVQSAGFMNYANEKSDVQVAGVLNMVPRSKLQIAGVFNTSSKADIQIAGVFNHAKDARVLQTAGVFNQTDNYAGQQYAGVFNSSDSSIIQVAGCFNNANQVVDVQVSGFINKACYVKGLQLGVINIADTCSGVPVGIFNFVRDGYHRLEISADELFYTNLAFRSGVKRLYTLFAAGISYKYMADPLWSTGFGIGTSFGQMDKLLVDLDISANQLIQGSSQPLKNNLYKLNIGIDRRIFRKVSIALGLSYNFLVTDSYGTGYNEIFSQIAPYTLTNKTNTDGYNHKTWIGGKVALRFF